MSVFPPFQCTLSERQMEYIKNAQFKIVNKYGNHHSKHTARGKSIDTHMSLGITCTDHFEPVYVEHFRLMVFISCLNLCKKQRVRERV